MSRGSPGSTLTLWRQASIIKIGRIAILREYVMLRFFDSTCIRAAVNSSPAWYWRSSPRPPCSAWACICACVGITLIGGASGSVHSPCVPTGMKPTMPPRVRPAFAYQTTTVRFVNFSANGKRPQAAVRAVPEPKTLTLLWLGAFALLSVARGPRAMQRRAERNRPGPQARARW